MIYFIDGKQVTYSEWNVWYENYVKEEKKKLINWVKRCQNDHRCASRLIARSIENT